MSVKFFGVGGPNQIGALKSTNQAVNSKKADNNSTDKVEFSSVLQEVNKARETTQVKSAQEVERSARVAELKAQIESGTYKPDLDQVAASLVDFIKKV